MENQALVFEKTLNAPIDKVWQAITNLSQMKKWYFDLAEFKPEVGFEFTFEGGTEEKTYIHLCKVMEVIPCRKLSYSWRYQGYEGNSLVTFELFEEGKQTRVKLTHEGLETFSTTDSSFARESFTEGWTYIIGSSLKDFVETKE